MHWYRQHPFAQLCSPLATFSTACASHLITTPGREIPMLLHVPTSDARRYFHCVGREDVPRMVRQAGCCQVLLVIITLAAIAPLAIETRGHERQMTYTSARLYISLYSQVKRPTDRGRTPFLQPCILAYDVRLLASW